MNRNEIIEEVKLRYLRNEPITEKEIVASDLPFFHAVLEEFGSWHKMESEVGLKTKHIREREKYFLFMMMKERKERFGIEALRHKNIEDEVKLKITEYFRTVKKLTRDILDGWSQDRVLFETHTYHLIGGRPENLKRDRSLLYDNIIKFFISIDNFYQEYEKHFLINPLKESQQRSIRSDNTMKESSKVVEPENNTSVNAFDLDTLVAYGFMEPEQADEIRKSAMITNDQIVEFVKELGDDVTSNQLFKDNRVMWVAIKKRFGGLEEAKKAISETNSYSKQA